MAGGGPQQQPRLPPMHHQQPPEVNIEVPSDSDSSRRASRVSYGVGPGGVGSAVSSDFDVDSAGERANSSQVSPARGAIHRDLNGHDPSGGGGTGSRRSSAGGGGGSRRESLGLPEGGGGARGGRRTSICATLATNHPDLLAARPVLDRRSSHTGVLFPRSAGPTRGPSPAMSPSNRHGGMQLILHIEESGFNLKFYYS